jgi:hypothetical protein
VSTPLKLAGFALLLVLVFGVARAAGGALGPDREGAAEQRAQEDPHGAADSGRVAVPDGGQAAGHGDGAGRADDATGQDAGAAGEHSGDAASGDHAGGVDAVRGLAVSDGGLTLDVARSQLPRGEARTLRFAIRDEQGQAVRDFDVVHEKRMHLIVVRRDGRGFQHLHPRRDAGGNWQTRLTIPQAGAYRVFADFTRDGENYTLATDLAVDGSANYRALPRRANVTSTDGYEVRLDADGSELRFEISRDGQPVTTQPYLGAGGHLVALREGDLAFLHVHPSGEGVAFEADLDPERRYRLYLQFKHDGRVHTAEFTR